MAMNNVLLDKDDLNKLLSDLADCIDDDEILKFGVCGGGALVYFYDFDYHTTDIDVFNISYGYGSLTQRLLEDISRVGKNNGVGSDWLNDAVSLPDFQRKDEFNINDMKKFLDTENDIWIYDSNGYPKINLVPVSLCGIVAAKLMAGRLKDLESMKRLFKIKNIRNEQDLEELFYSYGTFVGTDKYYKMLENANKVFEDGR